MNLPKIALLSLVILSTAMIGGWNAIIAAESNDSETSANAEDPVLMTPADPPAQDLEPSTQNLKPLDLEPPAPDLELPPAVEASCHTEDCGNTGTLYGWGANCTTAKADLNGEMTDAAYEICPGIVTGIDRNYGDCVEENGQCKYSGNADIECKICPGLFCE